MAAMTGLGLAGFAALDLVGAVRTAALAGLLPLTLLVLSVWFLRNRRARLQREQQALSAELLESETRYRLLFDGSRDAMMTLAPPSWKFTAGNPAALEMFGAGDAAEFTALGPWDASPERQPDGSLSAGKAREAIGAALREGHCSFEWTHRRLNGTDFPATVLLTRIEVAGQAFLQATVRDITAQKRAEAAVRMREELRDREETLAAVFACALHAIVMIDGQGRTILWNPAAEKMFGYTAAEMLGQPIHDVLVPAGLRPRFQANFPAFQRTGQGAAIGKPVELTALRKDGSEFPMEIALATIKKGREWHTVGVIRDLTERQRAEEALWLSEARFRQIVTHAGEGIALVDSGERFQYANPAAETMFGVPPNGLVGRSLMEFLGPEEFRSVLEESAKRRGGLESCYEMEILRPDGAMRRILVTAAPNVVREGQFDGTFGVFRDITERKQADEELRAKEYMLSESQRIAHVGSWSLEVPIGANACAWTPETYRLFGVSPETFVPSPEMFQSLIHPDDRAAMQAWIGACVTGEEPPDLEFRASLPGGGVRHILGRGHLVRDAENKPIRMAGIAQDITERKRAEERLRESEDRYRSLFEQSGDLILLLESCDGPPLILDANHAALRAYGYSREEVVGQPISLFEPDITRVAIEERDRLLVEGKPIYMCHRRKDGSALEVESVTRKVGVGAREIILAVERDITERKQAEEHIALYLLDLESARDAQDKNAAQLARLIEALEVEKNRAEAANRAKSEFLSTMSHEIRTPMNGVIGMTGLLLDTLLTPEQRGYAETVRGSGEALLGIINDILDFSKIEAGKLDLEIVPFDLRRALEDVVELLAVKAHEKGLELLLWYAPDAPRDFLGDAGRIRQVALNLVANAIKFTESGHVLVEAGSKAISGGVATIRIAVHDAGIGIPADRQVLLFHKFQQADSSTTRKYGGTGLGLAISRQLVELMGGTMGLASQVGEGSSVSFEIPLPRNPSPGAAPPPALNLDGVRVLVVDDHQICRFVIAGLCSRWGMRAEEAASGEEALRMAAAAHAGGDPYRLICLDHVMPEMDGAETARRLRKAGQGGEPAIILITSTDERDEVRRMSAAGCDACLVKPVREAVLLDGVQRVSGNREAGVSAPMWTRRPSPLPPAPKSREIARFAGRRVLLVEDNIVNQKLGVALLGKLGCQVDVAANGREALAMAAQLPYELIFMDCQMPEMDGYQAAGEIRGREDAARRTPIVALTAGAMPEDRERCLRAGMDDYLSKPVRAEQLREMLGKYLELPRLEGRGAPRGISPPI